MVFLFKNEESIGGRWIWIPKGLASENTSFLSFKNLDCSVCHGLFIPSRYQKSVLFHLFFSFFLPLPSFFTVNSQLVCIKNTESMYI